jgi:hypothetical protein
MSSASNLGYADAGLLNSNVSAPFVNPTSSNWGGSFTSNEIPGTGPSYLHALHSVKNNVAAADASKMQGGKRIMKMQGKSKRKIYSYYMHTKRHRKRHRHTRSCRHKRHRHTSSCRHKRHRHTSSCRHKRQRGGTYQQWQPSNLNNIYSLGGNLSPNESAMANPPIYKQEAAGNHCASSYNHYTDSPK